MASQFDLIRNRQRGEEAKMRVMERLSNPAPVSSESPSNSVFDAIRNRSIEPENSFGKPMAELQQQFGAVTPINLINAAMYDAQVNNQKNANKAAIVNKKFSQPKQTEYERRMEAIKDDPAPIRAFAGAMNKIFYDNPVGNFVSRIGHQADSVMSGGNPVTIQPDTGSKVANTAADIAGSVASVFTPTGAPVGTGPIAGTYGVADKVLTTTAAQRIEQAAANQLGKLVKPQTAQAITREALRETAAGTMQGAAFGAMTGEDDKGILSDAALGGVIGGATGAAFKAAGIGLSKLFKKNGIPEEEIAEILALPEGRKNARMAAASDRSSVVAGTDPITPEYTFDLPEATPATRAAIENAAEGRTAIQEIDLAINDLNMKYEQAVIDEYKYLKESRDTRMGRRPGSMNFDENGDFVSRTGWQSDNPQWYREFYAEHKKAPSNKDLYVLARKRVDEGFRTEVGEAPSWRAENGYDDQLAGLVAVRENLLNSVREIDPAVKLVEQPIVSQELKDIRMKPGGAKRPYRAPIEPVKPGTSQKEMHPLEREIMAKLNAGGDITNLSNDEIDFLLSPKASRTDNLRPLEAPKVDPEASPILRPGQFEEQSGIGITPFSKVGPYDSLSNETRSQLSSRLKREPVSLSGLGDRLYTYGVDDLHPLNKFDKLVEDVLEKTLSATESTHKLGLASRGADMTAKQIITDALVDSEGKVVGESLKEILSGLPKTVRSTVNSTTKSQIRKTNQHIYVDFEDYLINKHAVTRAQRGETVFDKKLNWTPEYGAQKVAEYEKLFPEFKETADRLYEFNRNMVDSWLVDTGIISPETAQAWFDANPFYVPNKRYFSTMEKRGGGVTRSKQGFGNQSVPVKGYSKTGSERKIVSPIEAMIENVDAFVKTAKRNQVMQQVVKNIQSDPEAFKDFVEVVVSPKSNDDLINKLLSGDAVDDLVNSLDNDFISLKRTSLDKDNIVRTLINGEAVHVKVNDPLLLDAVTALGPKAGNMVMDSIGWVTNKMKTLTTGANPVFSLTRNIFRDIPHAYIASKTTNNPIRFVADLADAAFQILTDGGLYQQFKRVGGGHSSSVAANRNLLAQSKRTVLGRMTPKDLGARLYYGLENVMNAVESAPRLAEFKRVSNGGVNNLQKALYEAQDLTVNFKRRGKAVVELDKIFPYMNAAIQGLDQIVRLYKNNPVQATVKAFVALTVPGAVLYAANHDDPNYQKMSNNVKDNFMLIPKGDGTFIKIAKPKELGTLFIDLPERMMRKFKEEDPAAFRGFADQLRANFLPPGIQGAAKNGGITDRMLGALGDTIAGPVADLAANRNFAGSPIVPGYLERLSPGLQSDAKTTNISRWIGEKTMDSPFEQSPKQLDYLMRQYTGVLGQLGQPLLSPGGDIGSTLSQQVTADPVFSNDLSNEFYRYKDKLDQAYANRELKKLPEWYNDPLRKQLNKISQNMSVVRKEIRSIQADEDMGNKEKREKLRNLQEKINNMADKGNEFARKYKIPY